MIQNLTDIKQNDNYFDNMFGFWFLGELLTPFKNCVDYFSIQKKAYNPSQYPSYLREKECLKENIKQEFKVDDVLRKCLGKKKCRGTTYLAKW